MNNYFHAFDNFEIDEIDHNVVGATPRGNTVNRKPTYGLTSYVPFKRRYTVIDSTTGGFAGLSLDDVDLDATRANINYLTCFLITESTTDNLYAVVRGQGAVTDGNYVQLVKSTNMIYLAKRAASASTILASLSFTLTSGHCYFVEIDAQSTTVRAKVWDAALGRAGRPTTWTLTGTTTVVAAGWTGNALFNVSGALEKAAFNFMAAATNGAVVECPLTNSEYTAWLDKQDAIRCIVAKMRFVKYDPNDPSYTGIGRVYVSNYGYNSHEQDTPSLQHFDNWIVGVPTFSREMPGALSGSALLNFGKLQISNPATNSKYLQNLILYSEQADNAAWTKSNLNVTANAIAAYDGVVRADKIYENTAINQFHDFVQSGGTLNAGCVYVLTAKVKAAGRTQGELGFYVNTPFGGSYPQIEFDLTAVTVTPVGGATGAIQSLGNGWYLLTCIATCTTTTAAVPMFLRTKNGSGLTQYTGDGSSGIYVDQMQFRNDQASIIYAKTGSAILDQLTGTELTAETGIRDDWANIHWLRDGYEQMLGDPAEALHNFRHVVRGRLGTPTTPDLKILEFPISDMSEVFKTRVVNTRIASGDYQDQFKPLILGSPRAVELAGDKATLVYNVNDSALDPNLNGATPALYDVTPTTFVHIGGIDGLTVSAVNTGTGEITASAPHGMVNGYRLIFNAAPPLGIPVNTARYVVGTTPGTDKYKLSLTPGGAAITGGAGTTTGTWTSYGYTFDIANATVTLVSPPTGRVLGFGLGDADVNANSNFFTDVLDNLFFNKLALSLNYRDGPAFDASLSIDGGDHAVTGYFSKTGAGELASAIADTLATGNRGWYGLAPDGPVQVGSVSLPAATSVMSFSASNIQMNSMRLIDTIRPVNFENGNVFCMPWFLSGGPVTTPNLAVAAWGVQSQEALQAKRTVPPPSYGAIAPPLDNYPTAADPKETFDFLSYDIDTFIGFDTRLVQFYKRTLGIFEFQTTLRAIELCIGQTISVDFPRLGWKQWSSTNPVSPDNATSIDSTKAVVIGISVNFSAPGPFKVKIKCFRQLPGIYPLNNLN